MVHEELAHEEGCGLVCEHEELAHEAAAAAGRVLSAADWLQMPAALEPSASLSLVPSSGQGSTESQSPSPSVSQAASAHATAGNMTLPIQREDAESSRSAGTQLPSTVRMTVSGKRGIIGSR